MLEIEQEIRKDGLKLNPTFGSTNKEYDEAPKVGKWSI